MSYKTPAATPSIWDSILNRSTPAPKVFTINAEKARAAYDARVVDEAVPDLAGESPGRSIEELLDWATMETDIVEGPEGTVVLVYPLIYPGDADDVLIAVGDVRLPSFNVSSGSIEWDDLVAAAWPVDSYHHVLDRPLTFDETTGIIQAVLDVANALLPRLRSAAKAGSS